MLLSTACANEFALRVSIRFLRASDVGGDRCQGGEGHSGTVVFTWVDVSWVLEVDYTSFIFFNEIGLASAAAV